MSGCILGITIFSIVVYFETIHNDESACMPTQTISLPALRGAERRCKRLTVGGNRIGYLMRGQVVGSSINDGLKAVHNSRTSGSIEAWRTVWMKAKTLDTHGHPVVYAGGRISVAFIQRGR